MLDFLSGLFRRNRNRPSRPETIENEPFHLVYERKRQPDNAGARVYAYESLGLASSSPIDRAVRVRAPILKPFAGPQSWQGQALKTSPMASQSGGMVSPQMLTADGRIPADGPDTTIDWDAVARNDPSAMANDASQVFGTNNPRAGNSRR